MTEGLVRASCGQISCINLMCFNKMFIPMKKQVGCTDSKVSGKPHCSVWLTETWEKKVKYCILPV